jgi:hypothetical protein
MLHLALGDLQQMQSNSRQLKATKPTKLNKNQRKAFPSLKPHGH